MWKNLDKTRKEEYFAMARKADAEHKMKYPGKVFEFFRGIFIACFVVITRKCCSRIELNSMLKFTKIHNGEPSFEN